jgi:hypothetical protein
VQFKPELVKATVYCCFHKLNNEDAHLFPMFSFTKCADMSVINKLYKEKMSKSGWFPVKKDDLPVPEGEPDYVNAKSADCTVCDGPGCRIGTFSL